MSGKDHEDPMDLGGFMKNFVHINPFKNNPIDGSTKTEKDEGGTSGKDKRRPYKSKLSTQIELLQKKNKSTKTNRTVKEMLATKLTSDGATNGESTESTDGGEQQVKTRPKSQPRSHPNQQTSPNSMKEDVALGYVGSNAQYAVALKNNLVSRDHRDAQMWLQENFRYIPEFTGLYPTNELVDTVQLRFPEISNLVLSRIMKFTFPNSDKIYLKDGVYYSGLVRKPQPEDYQSEKLLSQLSDITKSLIKLEDCKMVDEDLKRLASLLYAEHFNLPNALSVQPDHIAPDPPSVHQSPPPRRIRRNFNRRAENQGSSSDSEYLPHGMSFSQFKRKRTRTSDRVADKRLVGVVMDNNSQQNDHSQHHSQQNGADYSVKRVKSEPGLEHGTIGEPNGVHSEHHGDGIYSDHLNLHSEHQRGLKIDTAFGCGGDNLGCGNGSISSGNGPTSTANSSNSNPSSDINSDLDTVTDEYASLLDENKKISSNVQRLQEDLDQKQAVIHNLQNCLGTVGTYMRDLLTEFSDLNERCQRFSHKFENMVSYLSKNNPSLMTNGLQNGPNGPVGSNSNGVITIVPDKS